MSIIVLLDPNLIFLAFPCKHFISTVWLGGTTLQRFSELYCSIVELNSMRFISRTYQLPADGRRFEGHSLQTNLSSSLRFTWALPISFKLFVARIRVTVRGASERHKEVGSTRKFVLLNDSLGNALEIMEENQYRRLLYPRREAYLKVQGSCWPNDSSPWDFQNQHFHRQALVWWTDPWKVPDLSRNL